jgi:hypothetical protein
VANRREPGVVQLEVTVAEMNTPRNDELASSAPASSPDELVKDLDVGVGDADQQNVVGGRAGSNKSEYLIVKMNDVIIT